MKDHVLVSREDWTAARLEVLTDEKALMRDADALAIAARIGMRSDRIAATPTSGR